MNLAIYVLVYTYLNAKINSFMSSLMFNVMSVVSAMALVLLTLWIIIQGYRIVTGQSREPMMALAVNAMRIGAIVVAATTMSVFGTSLHDLFTGELQTDINQLFTGDNSTIQDSINKNLAQTVLAMAAIDAVQSPPGDVQTVAAKARASDYAIFGTASPPMAIGAMLLMYNFAVALFVGLGPLFILCLIFEQTKSLFQRWLLYGIGTLFSLAMLSFISSIVLSVMFRATAALWATNLINNLTGATSEGLTTQSMEQGGIGLLMTMLIISVPPMAANFFQGTLGQFYFQSAFSHGAGGGKQGADGQPSPYGGGGGSGYSGGSSTAQTNTGQGGQGAGSYGSTSSAMGNNPGRVAGNTSTAQTDTIKPAPPTAG